MYNRRFLIAFLAAIVISGTGSLLIWRFFLMHSGADIIVKPLENESGIYKEIDLIMPVHAFLKRSANSAQISMVRRLFVNQWISSNQDDLIKLVVYAQGATNFEELKDAFAAGIKKEGENAAAKFINAALKTISESPQLVEHVNKSLIEGFDQNIHLLRGELMGLEHDSREYKKLKTEYRKQLDHWMNEKHGPLLDEIIAKL
jgi:hypothetical protein